MFLQTSVCLNPSYVCPQSLINTIFIHPAFFFRFRQAASSGPWCPAGAASLQICEGPSIIGPLCSCYLVSIARRYVELMLLPRLFRGSMFHLQKHIRLIVFRSTWICFSTQTDSSLCGILPWFCFLFVYNCMLKNP